MGKLNNMTSNELFEEFWIYITDDTPKQRRFSNFYDEETGKSWTEAVYNVFEVENWIRGLKDKLYLLREAVKSEQSPINVDELHQREMELVYEWAERQKLFNFNWKFGKERLHLEPIIVDRHVLEFYNKHHAHTEESQ